MHFKPVWQLFSSPSTLHVELKPGFGAIPAGLVQKWPVLSSISPHMQLCMTLQLPYSMLQTAFPSVHLGVITPFISLELHLSPFKATFEPQKHPSRLSTTAPAVQIGIGCVFYAQSLPLLAEIFPYSPQ